MSKRTDVGGFLRPPAVMGAGAGDPSELPTTNIEPPKPEAEAAVLHPATVLDALEKRCPKCGRGYPRIAEECAADGATLVEAARVPGDSFVGAVIRERYAIEGILGSGGMGTVYEVIHVGLEKRFAMKILRPDIAFDKSTVERFIQEARLAASLKHPNLADVSDFGEISPEDVPAVKGKRVPFFVMELLRGETLGDVLRDEKRIEAARGAKIMRQIALGLSAAHELGIIHRDLKPDNVFLLDPPPKGASSRGARRPERIVKLLDFGIAKLVTGTGKLTKPDVVFGTPAYMSPEQASGKTLDARTDIYSLGVVMYEALTGRVPFTDELDMSIATKHQFEQPYPIEEIVPGDARLAALAPIVMRCLEKDRDARYASASDVVAALDGRAVRARRTPKLELLREETANPASERPPPRQRSVSTPPKPIAPRPGGLRVPLIAFAVGSFVAVTFVAYLRRAGPFAPRDPAATAEPSASAADVAASVPPTGSPVPSGPTVSGPPDTATARLPSGRPAKAGPAGALPATTASAASSSKVIQTW